MKKAERPVRAREYSGEHKGGIQEKKKVRFWWILSARLKSM